MSGHGTPIPMTSHPCGPLTGTAEVPGDKSISHRSVLLGAIADGNTHVTGFLEGEDTRATAAAMRQMGVNISADGTGGLEIEGVGLGAGVEHLGLYDDVQAVLLELRECVRQRACGCVGDVDAQHAREAAGEMGHAALQPVGVVVGDRL